MVTNETRSLYQDANDLPRALVEVGYVILLQILKESVV